MFLSARFLEFDRCDVSGATHCTYTKVPKRSQHVSSSSNESICSRFTKHNFLLTDFFNSKSTVIKNIRAILTKTQNDLCCPMINSKIVSIINIPTVGPDSKRSYYGS